MHCASLFQPLAQNRLHHSAMSALFASSTPRLQWWYFSFSTACPAGPLCSLHASCQLCFCMPEFSEALIEAFF